jgi:O-antigen/teichoic acid export membrane protein
LLSHLTIFILGVFLVKKLCLKYGTIEAADEGRLFSQLKFMTGSSLGSSLFMHGAVIAVGAVGSSESAGIYKIASTLVQPIVILHEVIGQIISPIIVRLWAVSELKEILNLLKLSVIISVISIGVGYLFIMLFGELIVLLIYDLNDQEVYCVALLLGAAHFANGCGGVREILLNMCGYSKVVFNITSVISAVSVLLVGVIAFFFGLYGVAVQVIIYQILLTFFISWESSRLMSINPSLVVLFR